MNCAPSITGKFQIKSGINDCQDAAVRNLGGQAMWQLPHSSRHAAAGPAVADGVPAWPSSLQTDAIPKLMDSATI